MNTPIDHWIGGHRVAGTSGRTSPVHNPATGEVTGAVPLANRDELEAAVGSAVAAARDWRRSSLSQRAAVLFAFREALHARSDELAAVVTAEHREGARRRRRRGGPGSRTSSSRPGSPPPQGRLLGAGVHRGRRLLLRQPLGVVAGVTPFNFPVMVPLWMCANAIACGNAFVLKPSERDPSASMLLAEMWKQAGLPDGVFTVLHGDKETVDGLLDHPDVAALSFVGSTPVARHVYERGTAHGKRVQALGGAKNHMVVLPDAEVELAADAAVSAAYGAAGERCMAISVAVAVGDVAEPLVQAVAARLPSAKVGDGMDPDTDMGP